MNSAPLVSIIIPTFNRAVDLNRAIKSILNQTYTNYEVIIVDNHSNDITDNVVDSFKNLSIKKFKIHNHGIIAKSRNRGILESRGEIIAFLDSDDWWTKDKLMESVNALLGGADIVYHDLWLVKKESQTFFFRKAKTRTLKIPALIDMLKNGNAITNSSVVVKKSIVEKVGYLSEEKALVGWEDFDYWIRISYITEKFCRIKKCLGYYWIGGGNFSSTDRTIALFEKILERYGFLMVKHKLISEGQKPWWIVYNELKHSRIGLLTLIKRWGQEFIFKFPLQFKIKLLVRLVYLRFALILDKRKNK